MKQIGLIPSGVQLWYKKVITLTSSGKLIYCSTIAVYIIDLTDYTVERILTGHTQAITSISKSPQFPNIIATSSLDQTIKLWEIDSGKEFRSIITGESGANGFKPLCMDWSPVNVTQLITGGRRGTLKIYDYTLSDNASTPISINVKSEYDVVHVAYNPKCPTMAFVGLKDGTVVVIDVNLKTTLIKYKHSTDGSKIVDYSWDTLSGHYLLCAYENGDICMYDTEAIGNRNSQENFQIRSFDKVGGGISSLSWIEKEPGNFMAADSRTGLLRFYNISQSNALRTLKVRKVGILEFYCFQAHSNDEERVAVSFRDGAVGVFNMKQKKMEFITPGSHTETIFACAFSSMDANIFATSSFDSTIKLWDISKMKCIDSLVGDKSVIYSIAWHPAKKIIAGGFGNGAVWIWDVEKRMVLQKLNFHKNCCFSIAWNKMDPSYIATASKDFNCCVFREDGKLLKTIRHPNVVFGVAWSGHDRNLLVTGCHDNVVRVYNVASSVDTPVKKLVGHTAEVFNVVWHPIYPNVVMSGSNDKTIRVWRVDTGESVVLQGHTNFVRALSFNPELPSVAVSGSWDGTVRVWDIRQGHCLHVANDHHADVYGLSVHPMRPFIYGSTSRDTTIRFWSLEPLFKGLVIKSVMHRDMNKCFGSAEDYLLKSSNSTSTTYTSDLLLCGPGSQEVNNLIKSLKNDVEKYEVIFNYFSFPHDNVELWNVVASSVLKRNQDKAKVIHRHLLTMNIDSKAKELESIKQKKLSSSAMARKADRLKEAALLYLKIGKLKQYCELMVEVGQYEKALAIAPAVSMEYWKELTIKYAQRLAGGESNECVPYYIATAEVDKLLNYYITRGQLEDATIVAQVSEEGGYRPIQYAMTSKPDVKLLNRYESNNPTDNEDGMASSELKKISEIRANLYLSQALPILAASCYVAIDDNDRAVRTLMNGDEIVLAYAVSKCLSSSIHNDEMYMNMVSHCEKHGLWEQGIELLQQVRDKSIVATLVSKISVENKDLDKLYIKAGLQTPAFYMNEAHQLESTDETERAVRSFALAREHSKACTLCIKGMRHLFSQDTWNWELIKSLASAMHCIDARDIPVTERYELLCYSSFIGGQIALWRGYYSVAPGLFQNAISLSTAKDVTSVIPMPYLDYYLCLAYSLYDQREAMNVIRQAIDNNKLKGYPDLILALDALKERLSQSDNVYSHHIQQRRNMVIPTASNLPLRSINGTRTRSFITQKEAKAPLYLINSYEFNDHTSKYTSEKKKYYASLSEMIMWVSVNPFSPLNDGHRIQL